MAKSAAAEAPSKSTEEPVAKTAPKTSPEAAKKTSGKEPADSEKPKSGEGEEDPAGKKGGKKKLLIIIAIVVLVAGGAGGGWFFMKSRAHAEPEAAEAAKDEKNAKGEKTKKVAKVEKTEKAKGKEEDPGAPPSFAKLEPFTVNLKKGPDGDQYLQVELSLKVNDGHATDLINLYTPEIRNRILYTLSNKSAADLATIEGKQKLADELLVAAKEPIAKQEAAKHITGVVFTSFIIQ